MKKFLLSPWLALFTLAILLLVKIHNPFLVDSMKLKFYDYLMLDKPVQSEQIVVVNIGEKAIEKYGQWPFPRKVHAEIIGDLYGRGAGLVGYTVLMPESDRLGTDRVLSDALTQYPVVLSQTLIDECARDNSLIRRTGVAVIGDGEPTDFLPNYPCVLDNIPVLQESAAGVGITTSLPETDGVTRRVPLLGISNGEYYPAFALELLRVAAGDPSYQAKINQTGVEALRVPQFDTVETDEYGRVFVNPNYQFSAVEIGEPIPDLTGKIVIVGVTAAGIANPVATPQGAQYPHVLQASILETLIVGDSVSIPNWVELVDLLAFVVLSVLIILLSRVTYSVIWIGILLAGYIYMPIYLFTHSQILFDISYNLLAVLVIYIHIYTVKFISEYLQKQQIKKQFAGYCSPTVVRMLQQNPGLIKEGMKREVSICFSDLRGFTPLGESFGDDVKGLTKLMNGYMDAITQPVLDADGMIIKYIGDASMHVHNAPNDDPDHAKSAVRTGLNMLAAVDRFNEKITAEGRPPIGMGAGINTGMGYLGEMGSSTRYSYDVLGDAVSTAARIESKCKEYGCLLLVGEATVKQCDNQFFFLKIDDLAVKGKTVGVGIYTVLAESSQVNPSWISAQQLHEEMHTAYRNQQFDRAIDYCRQLMNQFDNSMHKYYEMWIERCEYQKTQELPADWDGTFIATSK